jgi:hypothetical protein
VTAWAPTPAKTSYPCRQSFRQQAAGWFPGTVRMAMGDPRKAGSGILFPSSDPHKSFSGDMPAVQSLEGANVQADLTGSAEVNGEVRIENVVMAGSELIAIANAAKAATAKLTGMFNSSGPGSAGMSSPDAAAPAPSRGASGGW